jgi:phosphoglycolate phosphatase
MALLVAFDLDGTIIDSQLDLAESANEMLASYGRAPLAVMDVAGMVGDGARKLVERALAAAGVTTDVSAALGQFLEIYSERLLVHTRPYEGIRETIEAIAPRAWLALLTNKPEQLSRRLLEAFDLARHFSGIVGGDSGFPRKPDPAGLLSLVGTANASPHTTMLIGDSMIDLETARRAETHFCLAGYGFGQLRRPVVLSGHELVAKRSTDLRSVLEGFVAGLRTTT